MILSSSLLDPDAKLAPIFYHCVREKPREPCMHGSGPQESLPFVGSVQTPNDDKLSHAYDRQSIP